MTLIWVEKRPPGYKFRTEAVENKAETVFPCIKINAKVKIFSLASPSQRYGLHVLL